MSYDPTLLPAPIASALGSDAYPLGMSMFLLTTAQATADGGWPLPSSSQVVTFKTNTDRAFQFWARNNNLVSNVCYRQLQSATSSPPFSPWVKLGWSYAATNASLVNGWSAYATANYYTAQYWLDGEGYVNLGGSIKGGTVSGSYTVMAFTLPVGFIPKYNRTFMGGGENRITVIGSTSSPANAGNVIIATGDNGFVGLDGIRFYPDG